MPKLLTPQVIEANNFDRDRVPEGFDKPPVVAVVLPGVEFSQLIAEQTYRSFEYHLLRNFDFNMFSPFEFDADAFVEEAIAYCREHKVQGVTALNCFATLLASIVREELALPGPSFRGVLHCCNKYYMRKHLTPEWQPYEYGKPPPTYPAVVKVSDCQFYSHVRIVKDEAQWREAWKTLLAAVDLGKEKRQRLYHKWSTHFGFELEKRWEDIQLIHTEPYIKNRAEFQCEVVVTSKGEMLTADTGDIVHMDGGDNITMFKTPANLPTTPQLLSWLRGIVGRLSSLGYRSLAMDVEIMRLDSEEERYELCEINSRYSYMGDWRVQVPANLTDKRRAFVKAAFTSLLTAHQGDAMQAFKSFDSDGDASIMRDELEATMKRLGLYRKADDVDVLFGALDADGSGTVAMSEFQEALRQAQVAADKRPKYDGDEPREVRNLLNRARLSLGADPKTLPCRDQPGVSKLAVALFTDRLGSISDILDQKALDAYLEEGTFDSWCPEPPVTNGVVAQADLTYGGWARLGYLLMTWDDDLHKINSRLDQVIRDLFLHKDRGWLPVHLSSETPVPKELKPRYDMLEEQPYQKGNGCKCMFCWWPWTTGPRSS